VYLSVPLHHLPREIHLLVRRGQRESRLEDQQNARGEEQAGADDVTQANVIKPRRATMPMARWWPPMEWRAKCAEKSVGYHFGKIDGRSTLSNTDVSAVTLHASATARRRTVVRLGTAKPFSTLLM
jgi:hypothetical protein